MSPYENIYICWVSLLSITVELFLNENFDLYWQYLVSNIKHIVQNRTTLLSTLTVYANNDARNDESCILRIYIGSDYQQSQNFTLSHISRDLVYLDGSPTKTYFSFRIRILYISLSKNNQQHACQMPIVSNTSFRTTQGCPSYPVIIPRLFFIFVSIPDS